MSCLCLAQVKAGEEAFGSHLASAWGFTDRQFAEKGFLYVREDIVVDLRFDGHGLLSTATEPLCPPCGPVVGFRRST